MADQNRYDAQNITVLEGLDPVRKRPGMYIGGTGIDGLHHLVWEVVDNAVDEALAGFATRIDLVFNHDGSVTITDNGRGIPVDIHPTTKKSGLETVLTVLHAGAKFGDWGYKVSGGLHGVGVSVVNALSEKLIAEVYRDGKVYRQEYERGIPTADVKAVGETSSQGTRITFSADHKIFPSIEFNWQTVLDHCRQQAYLTRGLAIHCEDQRNPDNKAAYTFYFEGGIEAYVRHLDMNKQELVSPPVTIEKELEQVSVAVALTYTDDFNEHVYAFNNI